MPLPDSKNPGGCENPENKRPPPNLLKIIKDKAKAFDFYLDDPVARKIARAIPESSWFTDRHSIIDFVAQKIADIYSGKPKAELKKLFISALTSWENIRDEYPDWFRKQNKADELQALDRLRNTPPKTCPHCGAELEGRNCPKCKGYVLFDEETKAWKYEEHVDFSFPDFLKGQMAGDPLAVKPPETSVDEEPEF